MPAKHGMKGMERVDDRSGAAGGKLVKNYCGIISQSSFIRAALSRQVSRSLCKYLLNTY